MIVVQPSYRIFTLPVVEKGYVTGGQDGATALNNIGSILFATDTVSSVAAVLSVARWDAAGVNSTTAGYTAGGRPTNTDRIVLIDGLTFATETTTLPSAALSVARSGLAGTNSTTRGYFAGGSPAGAINTPVTEIDGVQFSSDTAINPTSTLSIGRYNVAGMNSFAKGFYAGGSDATTYSSVIDILVFSTEAATAAAASLTPARLGAAGVNSSVRGYFGGGYGTVIGHPATFASIDSIHFDTEAFVNTSATLATARYVAAGVNSLIVGYFVGGYDIAVSSVVTEIDGILFSTEASYNPSATISPGRQGSSGFQSGGIL